MRLVDYGFSFTEAKNLSTFDRKCAIYWIANDQKCRIDWKTGEIKQPKEGK